MKAVNQKWLRNDKGSNTRRNNYIQIIQGIKLIQIKLNLERGKR